MQTITEDRAAPQMSKNQTSSANLPEQVPFHFDISDSPKGYKSEQSQKSIANLNFAIVVFLMTVYLASCRGDVEPGMWIRKAIPVGLSTLTLMTCCGLPTWQF